MTGDNRIKVKSICKKINHFMNSSSNNIWNKEILKNLINNYKKCANNNNSMKHNSIHQQTKILQLKNNPAIFLEIQMDKSIIKKIQRGFIRLIFRSKMKCWTSTIKIIKQILQDKNLPKIDIIIMMARNIFNMIKIPNFLCPIITIIRKN